MARRKQGTINSSAMFQHLVPWCNANPHILQSPLNTFINDWCDAGYNLDQMQMQLVLELIDNMLHAHRTKESQA